MSEVTKTVEELTAEYESVASELHELVKPKNLSLVERESINAGHQPISENGVKYKELRAKKKELILAIESSK